MPLELHPEAQRSFNEKANNLVRRLQITGSKPMFLTPSAPETGSQESLNEGSSADAPSNDAGKQEERTTGSNFPGHRPMAAHFTS